MSVYNIVTKEDKILRKISKPIPEITPNVKKMLDRMLETMYASNGVGLAAPQMTYIMRTLRQRGLAVNTDVTTLEEAEREILRVLAK